MIAELGTNLGETAVKVLAVAGGAAVGAFAVGGLVQLIVRLTVRRPVPRAVLTPVRLLGAVAVGLAVWLFVFGSGGGGLGGSGWGFGGKGSGSGNNGTGTTQPGPAGSSMKERPSTAPVDRTQVVRIEMLGGKRYKNDDRYYLWESDKEPLTLLEVRKRLESAKERTPPVKAIEIVILEDSVSEKSPAVEQLRQLAGEHRLDLKVTTPGGGS
ncbi:MAG: hypothetical protein K2R98_19160 [Gemmataceae bacterium]|nr:hypothetical protein [Gemmataceae bacterium]